MKRLAILRFEEPPPPKLGVIERLETAWREMTHVLDPGPIAQGVRLRVTAPVDGRAITLALQQGSGVQSAYMADRSMRAAGRFHWPLSVGFGPSGTLQTEVESYSHPHLLDLLGVVDRGVQADLLIIDGAQVDMVEAAKPSMVLVFVDTPAEVAAGIPDGLDTNACSLVAVAVRPTDPDSFSTRLFDAFAHNFTPDRAIGTAARHEGPYFIKAHPGYVESARVSAAVARARSEIEEAHLAGHLTGDSFRAALQPLEILGLTGDENFTSEELEASRTTEGLNASRNVVDAAVPQHLGPEGETARPPRHLQAQVFAKQPALTQRLKSFEPDTPHKIVVRVGRVSLDWVSLPAEFPPFQPPVDEPLQKLTVHLIAPALRVDRPEADIYLPVTGDSTPAEFEVYVPAGVDQIDATVIVYRGTTHVQTAVLRGGVAAGDVAASGREIRFRQGDVSSVDLESHEDADLSLRVMADTVEIVSAGKKSRVLELPGLADAMGPLREKLFETAEKLEGLQQPLESENGTKLVYTLALQGEFLRRRMFGNKPPKIESVDVTSPSSGSFLPVEFFYDHPKPKKGAKMCSEFRKAKGADCPKCEAAKDPRYVCPSGFWALRKVIERQIRSVDSLDCVAAEPHIDSNVLPATRDVVFAASDEVNTSTDLERVANTIKALEKIAGQVHVASTWDLWRQHISDHSPVLLVALPHNVDGEAGFQALQIGKEEDKIELAINDIEPVYVGPAQVRPGPVMLLLGCNVADPKVEFQDFVRQMRCNGAALVVGTLTYVLGQQAAPFATALVEALWANQGNKPFGEILRSVRADMLRADNPMALAVTAYGAADWKFTTGGN
jgi:hypothetical protein